MPGMTIADDVRALTIIEIFLKEKRKKSNKTNIHFIKHNVPFLAYAVVCTQFST